MENSNRVKLFELAYNGKILETSKQHKTVSCDSTKVKLSEFNLCPKIGLRAVGLQWFKQAKWQKNWPGTRCDPLLCSIFPVQRICETEVILKSSCLTNWREREGHNVLSFSTERLSLREKCPNTELFQVCIFLYSDWIQENTDQK